MGRKLLVRRGMQGETSTGETSTGEAGVVVVGEREISSRRSAMDFVSSRRVAGDGTGESSRWTGGEVVVPNSGAMLIRIARGARVKIWGGKQLQDYMVGGGLLEAQ
jgi:hypothetical protein